MPDSDLIGVGGDLEPATLIAAYRRGLFPMLVNGDPGLLGWWSPDPRAIVPLDGLRVTRSMRQSAKRHDSNRYQVRGGRPRLRGSGEGTRMDYRSVRRGLYEAPSIGMGA